MFKRISLGGGLLLTAALLLAAPSHGAAGPVGDPTLKPAPASAQPSEKDTQVDPECTTFCCLCNCC